MKKDTILNVPRYAADYRYIVARRVDGDLWFYGAWNDADKANEVALDIDGETIDMTVWNVE